MSSEGAAPRRHHVAAGVVLLFSLLAGCTAVTGEEAALVQGGPTSVPPTSAVAVPPGSDAPAAPSPTGRRVHQQAWSPFVTAGGIVLRHPSSRVEMIGFHQSTLDGAQELQILATSAPTATLEDRERDTGTRTAADVVVDPDVEIRAPVTGEVLYSGTYVLYCDYSDDFLVIEPDDHPGWEVKMLHIDGVQVRPGMRVQAGQTVVAPLVTRLPFPSQVDKLTTEPAWPHVHIEIDDPNVPDRPTGPGC